MLVAVVALLCSVTVSAFEVNGIYYKVTSGTEFTVEVTDRLGKYSGEIVVPSTVVYDEKTYSVTSIGEYAFYGCDGLTSITIPNSVTSIGFCAFAECSSLRSITIPNSVTSIGPTFISNTDIIFTGCTSLASIVVEPGNTVYDSRENCNAIIETATNTLVNGCKNTAIPNSVTTIAMNAFSGCAGLTNIEIPNSVTNIREYAFYFCDGLTSVTIPNSVTNIGEYAFYGCAGLTNIVVEGGNSVYDSRENCNAIIETATNTLIQGCKNTIIPNSITCIGKAAFGAQTSLTNINIPNSVTHIGWAAFTYCTALTNIKIPNSVTSIEGYAFNACDSLTSITIPNSVTSIEESVFQNCDGLTSVTIPNSVTSIGGYAFYGCDGLTSITIPNSVTEIGNYIFQACHNLTSIYVLSATPANVDVYSFSYYFDNLDITLYVPQGAIETYKTANGWKIFKNIVEFDPTAIEDVADEEDAPVIKVAAGGIQLTDAEGKTVAVYTTAGALVEKIDSYAGEEITLDKGVYIICVGDKAVKVRL